MNELDRIRCLPERDWQDRIDVLTDYLTETLRTATGTWRLHPHQAAAIADIADYGGAVLGLPVGTGKAQPDTEPVLTEEGWKPIGQITTKDKVCGSDGQFHNVLGVFPQGKRPAYRLTFSDGSWTECDEEHLWTFDVVQPNRKKHRMNITCAQLLTSGLHNTKYNKRQWLYWLPMTMPVQATVAATLPLDPYTLGALIGDGSFAGGSPKFCSADIDIVEKLVLPPGTHIRPTGAPKGRAKNYILSSTAGKKKGKNPLTEILRALGLWGHKAHDKHVPSIYKKAPPEQRLELLRGLFDTDGSVRDTGVARLGTVSKQLAMDIQDLVTSLAGTCVVAERRVKALGGLYPIFMLDCKLPADMNPFKCERKSSSWEATRKRHRLGPRRSLREIVYIGEVPCTCISVDSPDRLYHTRHHILTHNTAVSLLAPVQVQAKRPLLLIPANLKAKTHDEIETVYAPQWKLHSHYYVQTYQTLSRDYDNAFLTEAAPDFIFADEAHWLANTKSACWKRLKQYLIKSRKAGYPVRFVAASGTLMNREIKELAHLLRAALGKLAPVPGPKDWELLADMSRAMSTKCWGPRPDPKPLHALGESDPNADDVTRARQAFGDRLARTPGIIIVPSERPPYGLEINPLWVDLPSELEQHFDRLREKWRTPDDHPFDYPMQLWAHARELACGFFYRPTPRPPQEYVNARRNWCGFRSDVLARSRTYLSPGQLADAIRRGEYPDPGEYLATWTEVQNRFSFEQEAVWLDDTLLNTAAEWLEKNHGICWVEHLAFAEALRKLTGLPLYGESGIDIRTGKKFGHEKRRCIATLACAVGQNPQENHWHNLVISATPTGKLHEQLIGRTHRFGQKRDTVYVDYTLACMEQFKGFWQAYEDSTGNADYKLAPDAKMVIATNLVPRQLETVNLASSIWR